MRTIIITILTLAIIFAIQAFKNKRPNNTTFLEIGRLMFPDHQQEFDTFFNLFLSDKKKFNSKYKDLLAKYEFDNDNLKPIEVLYVFADSKGLVYMADWRGEGVEKETETFLDKILKQKHPWTKTEKLRSSGVDEESQDNGLFVMDLFRAIDQDLQTTNHRLIFFYLGWDAYVYTTVDSKTYNEATSKLPADFHGVDKLKN